VNDIIVEAKKRFLCVGMTTNGTQVLNAAPDILWVSIDGKRATHDYLRGEGVYQRLIANIKQSSHPRILGHITINSMNVHEVPEVIRELSALVKGFTIQFYYPYTNDHSLLVTEKDRIWVLDELIGMKNDGYRIMNSIAGLQGLKRNTWRCEEWLVDNANPDGSILQGCYLKDRARIHCGQCGFSPFTEMSLAYHLHPSAILTGMNVFFP
jgi:MoaA/NifB/PqqE/SkfB family radical SAM enzyme